MSKEDCNCAICILAGGLSTRMGMNKASLRLGSKTVSAHIRAEAQKLGLPLRTIRRDLVPRCGPLGGVYTGLKTSEADAELFLACDMPFVSAELLMQLVNCWTAKRGAVFAKGKFRLPSSEFRARLGEAGFPFLLPVRLLPAVERQISKREFSLQDLARAAKATLLPPLRGRQWELFNVNTQADWQGARKLWRQRISPDLSRAQGQIHET